MYILRGDVKSCGAMLYSREKNFNFNNAQNKGDASLLKHNVCKTYCRRIRVHFPEHLLERQWYFTPEKLPEMDAPVPCLHTARRRSATSGDSCCRATAACWGPSSAPQAVMHAIDDPLPLSSSLRKHTECHNRPQTCVS